ncbi:MAG: phosphodiesterase [Chloroflexota bacterium]|nr:MAG: phosphodiesterase [Chloroflexota bacterium]
MNLFNSFKRKPARPKDPKVFVIGLDCAAPELVFDRWQDDLPNLRRLTQQGLWGELESCTPAITVPAWSCMLSSKDPGTLGIYGFRNRADHSYDKMFIATSVAVKHKRVWDYLSEAGKTSVVVGVPQTYPVKPLNGSLIGGFLTPSVESDFAYPASLKDEVLAIAPDYDFDVRQFRTNNKDWLLQQIHDMTEKRFRVVDHLLSSKPWDFFMVMEIGVDRIHHGFWSYHDPQHFRYVPGNPYENAIHDYYVKIDRKIGEWLDEVGKDTVVMVVSDHGAKRMDGGICLNEWLWRNGYLCFKQDPPEGKITRFEDLEVDWPRTVAWGDGGYYGRLFINLKGRETQGAVSPEAYEEVRQELAGRLAAIPGPQGENIGTKVFKPEDIYHEVNGVAPDLIVYFGDLLWRSVGSLGHGSTYTFENDTGPDDCNHAQNGMFILHDPMQGGVESPAKEAQLMDVAPTILSYLGAPVPADMQGKNLWDRNVATNTARVRS